MQLPSGSRGNLLEAAADQRRCGYRGKGEARSAWLEQIVREGVRDGSIASDRPPEEIVTDLSALVDGLGLQLVRGLMSADQARQTVDRVMVKFGLTAATPADGTDETAEADETSELEAIEGRLRAALRRLERLRANTTALRHAEDSARRPATAAGSAKPTRPAR